MTRPALKVLHVNEDGELVDPGCPHVATCETCRGREILLTKLEEDLRVEKIKRGRLEADPEAKARAHKLWSEAECAHTWWRLACYRPDTAFEAAEFAQAKPRLMERDGLENLLKAIAGAAYDPGTKRMKNGDLMVYDDFELICRSKPKLQGFQKRVYGSERTEKWKGWLIARIESNLKEEK
jgi:hypothetical protein